MDHQLVGVMFGISWQWLLKIHSRKVLIQDLAIQIKELTFNLGWGNFGIFGYFCRKQAAMYGHHRECRGKSWTKLGLFVKRFTIEFLFLFYLKVYPWLNNHFLCASVLIKYNYASILVRNEKKKKKKKEIKIAILKQLKVQYGLAAGWYNMITPSKRAMISE